MAITPRMEPEWDDGKSAAPKYLSVLLLGAPKIGKTTAAVGTTPGPVYVIDSDGRDSLVPVRRHHPNAKFAKNAVNSIGAMEAALVLARSLVKEGKIKTIVWDTMSTFGENLEPECFEKTKTNEGNLDGRKAYPMYTKLILGYAARLMKIECHVVVCCHYIDSSNPNAVDAGTSAPKIGPGIVPLLATKEARNKMGKEFSDILFMEREKSIKNGDRLVIRTAVEGVWGPGGRNTSGSHTIEPSFQDFMKLAGFKGIK